MYGRFQGIGNSVVTSPRSSGSAELAFGGSLLAVSVVLIPLAGNEHIASEEKTERAE